MKTPFIPCIIFSVEKSTNNNFVNGTNKRITEASLSAMKISYEKVLGNYQGTEEMSYIVTDMTKLDVIIGIAREFDQESILLRNEDNDCKLYFLESKQYQPIGKLEAVTVTEALNNDSYTYSPRLNQYFICR